MRQLAEWPSDLRPRRYVAAVPHTPYADEPQFRIEPGVLGNLGMAVAVLGSERDPGVQIQMQMIRRRKEDLALVNLQFPGLIANPGMLALNLAQGRNVARGGAVEEQDILCIRHPQHGRLPLD